MKLSSLSLLFSALGLCVACGGSEPAPVAPSSTTGSEAAAPKEGHDGHGHEGKDHHAGLAAPLKDFHGVISPVWHTPAGKERVEKACTSSKSIGEKAQATSDAEFVSAAGALDQACAKEGRPDVEAKLSAVHDRFHALAKMEKHDEKTEKH